MSQPKKKKTTKTQKPVSVKGDPRVFIGPLVDKKKVQIKGDHIGRGGHE